MQRGYNFSPDRPKKKILIHKVSESKVVRAMIGHRSVPRGRGLFL